jgi:hypothetical protein
MDEADPRDEIVRIEALIEDLAAKVENCRKFILAARIAIVGGGILLASVLFGIVGSDPALLATAVAALLGGIVVWGSNDSTTKEAAHQLAAAEANRAALIGTMDLRVVAERRTLH